MMRRPALSAAALLLVLATPAAAIIEVAGEEVEVIDLHLHPGHWAQQPLSGKTFLVGALPGSLRPYAPALFETLLDPFAEHVGIAAQTRWAGVDQAVLLAVYAHHTSGYYDNAELVRTLADPASDGWAWGMVSVNLDDISDPAVSERRLERLRAMLDDSDRLIGIKLAHAHQQVAFDDEVLTPVYDLAAEYGLPVLLHTGFSPFPNARTEPPFYDPLWLEGAVSAHDGQDGRPRVEFVLSHVGQGDARAIDHALDLADAHDNVWLELSALDRPLSLDGAGQPVDATDPQFPDVVTRIRQRGLVDRALFATDGPQFSGMVRRYVDRIVTGLVDAGYDLEEIRAVMGGNARRLFDLER
jgi:uncharacterized protein